MLRAIPEIYVSGVGGALIWVVGSVILGNIGIVGPWKKIIMGDWGGVRKKYPLPSPYIYFRNSPSCPTIHMF